MMIISGSCRDQLTKELSFRDLTDICQLRQALKEPAPVVAALQGPNFQPWLSRSNSSNRRIEFGWRSEEIELKQQRGIEQVELCLLLKKSKSEIYSAGFANSCLAASRRPSDTFIEQRLRDKKEFATRPVRLWRNSTF